MSTMPRTRFTFPIKKKGMIKGGGGRNKYSSIYVYTYIVV